MDYYTPRPGDVVRYTPSTNWCREGIAIAQDQLNTRNGIQRHVLLDTYWHLGTETHVLEDNEAATAEFMFNLADYDELERYSHESPRKWEKYAPDDRQLITSQHGLQKRWFIRKGAKPDWATQIENARQVVTDRKRNLDFAQSDLRWANEDLARVIDEAEAADYLSRQETP
ncbi:Uncharacterised protein [Mycobacteroides abscessus subsp. abscessus]|uniref:hypothetical protein n=1 Tax=Mycobacteroides abscessus TaxID=36809 RepID=UPI0009275BBB|nr:hypothetical protein [Mycobacteroides abscessus]SIE37803.1 Uncharacterised protein [Mycobacteroides abscessus subsp. abscessus]SKV17244.1 Uncharacterised protein [Mycobacteroides abscessus subsp. abscessus]